MPTHPFPDDNVGRMQFLLTLRRRGIGDAAVLRAMDQVPREHFVEQWRKLENDAKDLAKQLLSKEYGAPSATWKLLMSTRPELILFLDLTTRHSAVEQKIKAFLSVRIHPIIEVPSDFRIFMHSPRSTR